MPTDFLSKRSFALDTFAAAERFFETKMRKTRLVILPTKCLHQMGFLLLFLSCPVIGDWGRIRPESEDSHNAIQIDREGTCGLERDPPGGLQKFLDEDGSKQCRLSEDTNTNIPSEAITRSDERRIDVRRISQRRTIRESERRTADDRRRFQRDASRNVRSRSADSRRSLNSRNDARTRSLSLDSGRGRTGIARQRIEINSRRESERFHLSRRMNERQSERREQQILSPIERRNSVREIRNAAERRENERVSRTVSERRERETARLARSEERERQDSRRSIDRRSVQEQSRTRENDVTRRQERAQNERRLSPQRREPNEARRIERTDSRRNSDRITLDRRMPETRGLDSIRRKPQPRENYARLARNDNRRDTEGVRRLVTATPKTLEWNIREKRSRLLTERDVKSRRESRSARQVELEYKKTKDEGLFEGVTKWMDLKSYDSFNTGDWTTNCIIGAVVYYFTTRQIKAV